MSSKYDILPADHPKIIRRLAKELNRAGWYRGESFYVIGTKYDRARCSKGKLEIAMGDGEWTEVAADTVFCDGYGQAIAVERIRGRKHGKELQES